MFALILVYLVLTIIRPQDYVRGLVGVPVLPMVLMLAFLSWLATARKDFSAPQFFLLPLFLLALMMSEVANSWFGGALEQLQNFAPVVISFFVLATAVSASPSRVQICMAVFALSAMVLAWHGVDQYNHGIGWTGMGLSEDRRIQYVGIFNDPNDLGLLFVASLPMAVYLSSLRGWLLRLFWLAGAALLLYGVYLTNSRGAFLAVMAIAAVYLWRRRGLMTSAILSTIGLMVLMLLPTRVQDIDVDESSAAGRVDAWYEGLHMFKDHPLFGVGAGNFTEYNYLTAHNSFVLVLAETGLFGYILWLAFVGYAFMMTWRILGFRSDEVGSAAVETSRREKLPRQSPWDVERNIALTLLLSLSGMFAAAFFLSRSYMIVMYLLIAMVVGHFVGARRRFPQLAGFSLIAGGWLWLPTTLASIVALFIVVAVLMHSS